jgi:hypothetical protein
MALGAGLHENGIDLRVTVMDSGNAALAAVLGGSVAPAGPGEVLAAKMHGRDIVVVVNFYRGLLASLMLDEGSRGHGKPRKIDTCYAYSAERELVKRRWPEFHRIGAGTPSRTLVRIRSFVPAGNGCTRPTAAVRSHR